MIIAITGLICAGKTKLTDFLKGWGYEPVIEYTTRPIRKGEQDGVSYHFIDDREFNRMDMAGEFAETLYVKTKFGLWKYGARTEDMKDGHLLICGPHQMKQLLSTGVPMLSVLLDISKGTATERATARHDDLNEFNRRWEADRQVTELLKGRVDMVLDGADSVEKNARAIDSRRVLENHKRSGTACPVDPAGSENRVHDGSEISTAQPMDEGLIHMYLDGDKGLAPYLRMRDRGMPQKPVNQIAWLLLNGGGCGFCMVCREKPCGIKDGEKCTMNIANYIRDIVHEEDAAKKGELEDG